MKNYDCDSCAAFCCGYPLIEVTRADIARLAEKFRLPAADARQKFTLPSGRRRKMRQQKDPQMKTRVCMFLDLKTRRCGVYRHRPQICRDFPGARCEWHDRRTLESIARNGDARGKKVFRIKVAPWTIDADYPIYDESRLPALVEAYAHSRRGKIE